MPSIVRVAQFPALLGSSTTLTAAAPTITVGNTLTGGGIEAGDRLVLFYGMERITAESTDPSQRMTDDGGLVWTPRHEMEIYEGGTLRIRAGHYEAVAPVAIPEDTLSLTLDFFGRSTRAVAMLGAARDTNTALSGDGVYDAISASYERPPSDDGVLFSHVINFDAAGSGGALTVAGFPDSDYVSWSWAEGYSYVDASGKRYDFAVAYGYGFNEPISDVTFDTRFGSDDLKFCLHTYLLEERTPKKRGRRIFRVTKK